MSEPTPPSKAPPSAPPPPERDTPRAGRPGGANQAEGETPLEVRRARNLYTVVAAFLVFIGVTSLMSISESVVAFRTALNDADPSVSEQISNGMIKTLLVLTGVATLMVAVGHGLTSHALSERRSWSRPLGLTFSGILLGLAALNILSGAQVMPSFFFAIAGLLGISLLSRPEVRDYLRPRWGGPNGGPPNLPPGPPPSGMPTPTHQAGQWAPPPGQSWTPNPPPSDQSWTPSPPPDSAATGRQPDPDTRPSGESQ